MVQTMEKEMASILDSASLFEVNVPDYKQLKQCRKELCMLKLLWDYVSIVTTSIEDWKTTPWLEINVEQMDMDCKKFAKDIRTLDKEMRAWDTYTGVESTVKNMLTSLRAVSELQNSAIRDRHWAQLMQATGVSSFASHINMMILIISINNNNNNNNNDNNDNYYSDNNNNNNNNNDNNNNDDNNNDKK